MYQYINLDGIPYSEAVKKIGFESHQLRKIKKDYNKICTILEGYSLK